MKVTKNQLKRIIREEKARLVSEAVPNNIEDAPQQVMKPGHDDHHWPRIDWTNIGEIVDKWVDMEEKSWDTADPSMNPDDVKNIEAKKAWEDQVENAGMDMEAELTKRIRKVTLDTMKEFTDLLIGGEYL